MFPGYKNKKNYLRKQKKTAAMMHPNAAMWFHWMGWLLNTTAQIMVNTVSDMHSCIILSCMRLKGPPLMLEPILFAGTIALYSKKAMAHEDKMMSMSGQLSLMCISESLSCPYHAKVMKILEMTSNKIVQKACMIPSF